jgi:hypothetical protein
MTPFLIGIIQFVFSLIIYSLITIWFVHPLLKTRPWRRAVVPLLLVHAFRYSPLTLLMPGQVNPTITTMAKETIAYGDLSSAVLALLAALLVFYEVKGSKAAVWLFSVVGIFDIVLATSVGISAGFLRKDLGFNLYILNFYVPMLIVTHILILRYLLRRSVSS